MWIPTVVHSSKCTGSGTWWPKEELLCQLTLGSWTHSKKTIDIAQPTTQEVIET